MNYYPFHIGDYVSATRHLSWEEDAAFRRLLDTYYTTEKPLPAELRAVCRLVMAQTESQREAVRVVLEEFFTLTADGWVNKRADIEIAAMRDKQQKQRDKANKRWEMLRAAPGNAAAPANDAAAPETPADAMPPTPTPTPTPTPRENNVVCAAAPAASAAAPAASAAAIRGTRLDADWSLPKAWGEWALAKYPHWDAETVRAIAGKFRNHWVAKTGKDATKRDWKATWENWCDSGITQGEHPLPRRPGVLRHAGFDTKDYRQGVTEDGHLA